MWENAFGYIDAKLGDAVYVKWASEKTGSAPRVVVGSCALGLAAFSLWVCFGELINFLVAYLYPTYASFRALEDGDVHAIGCWLTYWVTYAFALLFECLFYQLLIRIPFYCTLRLLFVIWLFVPGGSGAMNLYRWVVSPLVRSCRPSVDETLFGLTGRTLPTNSHIVFEQTVNEADIKRSRETEEFVRQELIKAHASRADMVNTDVASGACPRGRTEGTASFATSRARIASPRPLACGPVPTLVESGISQN